MRGGRSFARWPLYPLLPACGVLGSALVTTVYTLQTLAHDRRSTTECRSLGRSAADSRPDPQPRIGSSAPCRGPCPRCLPARVPAKRRGCRSRTACTCAHTVQDHSSGAVPTSFSYCTWGTSTCFPECSRCHTCARCGTRPCGSQALCSIRLLHRVLHRKNDRVNATPCPESCRRRVQYVTLLNEESGGASSTLKDRQIAIQQAAPLKR